MKRQIFIKKKKFVQASVAEKLIMKEFRDIVIKKFNFGIPNPVIYLESQNSTESSEILFTAPLDVIRKRNQQKTVKVPSYKKNIHFIR